MEYTYTTYVPPPTRMAFDDLPDHRFAYTKRIPHLDPKERASFQARCSCKWKDKEGPWATRTVAHRRWEAHIMVVQTQATLPL